jgi:uncharacterized protein (DUF697 family)
MKRWIARPLALLAVLACGHSDGFEVPPPQSLGPNTTGPDVQLTFNTDQDYWPTWTQDGRGILYSFVSPGSTASHRCLGILPAAGGSRIWEMCDNRAVRRDTVSSYTAFALDNTGRLLFVEAVGRTGLLGSFPAHIRLYVADTAAPYVRTLLDTIPVAGDAIGSTVTVSWLSDLAWTSVSAFIALGQQYGDTAVSPCNNPFPCRDSTFAPNGVVLRGTIGGGLATLAAVAGTEGAAGYSLAESGATVAFITRGHDLYKVPIGGGPRITVGTVSTDPASTLLGVTCRGTSCLVASTFSTGPAQLIAVSLVSGQAQVVRTTTMPFVATPMLSPVTHDVVVQAGGVFGHVATRSNNPGSNLFLYQGIFP